jgi:hypothetical protein
VAAVGGGGCCAAEEEEEEEEEWAELFGRDVRFFLSRRPLLPVPPAWLLPSPGMVRAESYRRRWATESPSVVCSFSTGSLNDCVLGVWWGYITLCFCKQVVNSEKSYSAEVARTRKPTLAVH